MISQEVTIVAPIEVVVAVARAMFNVSYLRKLVTHLLLAGRGLIRILLLHLLQIGKNKVLDLDNFLS